MATLGSTGWPYVQHRGGSKGFLKVIDERTIAFADFRGNKQYISTGTLTERMKQEPDLMKRADLAIRTVLSRPARQEELQALVSYMQRRQDRPEAANQQVVWVLLTNAEFRFNH